MNMPKVEKSYQIARQDYRYLSLQRTFYCNHVNADTISIIKSRFVNNLARGGRVKTVGFIVHSESRLSERRDPAGAGQHAGPAPSAVTHKAIVYKKSTVDTALSVGLTFGRRRWMDKQTVLNDQTLIKN